MTGKPTAEDLGIDVAAQRWHRSGDGDGAIEVAMVSAQDAGLAAGWVLMRVAGDPSGRVLVYDRHESSTHLSRRETDRRPWQRGMAVAPGGVVRGSGGGRSGRGVICGY
jgi:hypothetical protein